jgi:histidinol-phosphate aminotransferase
MTKAVPSIEPRMRVRTMPEYHPPLGNRNSMRLDFNENTVACSPAVLAALQGITAADLTRYPEREPVEALAAQHLGIKPDAVVLTNGVDEAIHILCQAFLDAGDELLLPVPTYTMYGIYAAATEATVVRVPAEADFRFPFEALLAAITPRTKLIAIANPNSPTGSIATRGQILALAQAAPHALVLVDEAYFHFYGETVLDMISKIPNIIVARTFSKAYGLAALRLGLLAGSPMHLQWARRVLSPYSVNHVALTCLGAALNDQSYLDWYVKEVTQARGEFLKELTRIGVRHWPTEANFVLVEIGSAHKQFAAAMQHQGVLVRDRSADPGCDGCVRITIGTRSQMQVALAAIEAFLHSPQPVGVTP